MRNTSATDRMLVRSRDAAKTLDISERSLFSLEKSGAIKALRIGRAVRYAQAELERFASEGSRNDVR